MSRPQFSTVNPQSSTPLWRLDSVATNSAVSYERFEGTLRNDYWWKRGGIETAFRLRLDGFTFPLGTNEVRSLIATAFGAVRAFARRPETEILASTSRLAAEPFQSEFWYGRGTNANYFLTWRNFRFAEPPHDWVNAQIELKSSGDFIVRSNEVETAYRRIEPFDWDGDGLPNEIDPNPYDYDGDYFGQNENWVRTNFARFQEVDASLTNVEQILSVGYANWVNAAVGVGQTNGLYRLSVRIDEPLRRRTVLSVGATQVVVTNAGEYVFLLEKGPRCQIECEPNVGELICMVTDDLGTPDSNLKYWYEDPPQELDGELHAHFGWDDGWVQWMPHGEVTASPAGWGSDNVAEPVTLTAEIRDVAAHFVTNGHWVSSNTCFRIETPNASTTCVMYAGATDTACGGTIGYEVCFGNDIYQPGIGFGYDLSRRMRPHVTLTAPSVLFNNDDDDKTIDDDRAPVRIGFESDPAYATNGTLRLTASGVTLWASQAATDRMPLGTTLTFPDFSTQSNLTLYVDRTGGASLAMDDLSLTLEWIEGLAADGEAQFSSNGAACVVHTMTALEPVLEPIFYQFKNIGGTNHVINPCCVVHGGRDAWFQLRNIPSWFPRNRIVWSCDDPAVQFVGGNTGTSVCVRAAGPTQYGGEGYPALSMQIGDACSSRPKCHFATVPEVTTIRLYPHIVTERKSPISFDQITNMVNRANDIYSQIGIRFVMDPIDTFKLPSNVVNVVYASADSRNRVRNLVNHTRGIDVFFVDRIIGTRGFSDPLGNKVVCDASKCVTGTLAHEIGHTFGLDDVFYFKRVANGQYYKLPGELVPETTLEKYDRSGATGIRYYSPNALWASVTARCIMCSGAPDATRLDIPMGSVRGFVSVDRIRQEVAVGVANVGLSSVSVRHINDIKEQ